MLICMELLIGLGLSLAIGLLVGVERGWQERDAPEGARIAGIRTFGLVGLLGGLWAVIGEVLGMVLLGIAFAAIAALMITSHMQDVRNGRDVGVTTVVAALVTFALGALAVLGYTKEAAAGAVVTTALLSLKPVLHGWLRRIESLQLFAGIKLLLISVVVLPVLPDQGYGPWQALNPYQIWWMVVLIAAISFAGYVAMRAAGVRRGVLLTGLLGGLASSTATTVTLARLQRGTDLRALLAAGIVAASAIMFPRILLEVAVVNRALLAPLVLPLALMTAIAVVSALWLAHHSRTSSTEPIPQVRNPMELIPALQFGLFLAVVMLLTHGLNEWLGERGLYLLAAISGVADVDAITLSLANLARGSDATDAMWRGIILAAMVNTVFKGVLATFIAGRALAVYVLPAMGLTALIGLGWIAVA
jgi:uncharacterized membrane protein (DUF4010 family)